MRTFQILWREDDGANHVDEVYAFDRDTAVAAGLRKHPRARHVRVL